MKLFKRDLITVLSILCVVSLLISCTKNNEERDQYVVVPFHMFVEFEGINGTNLLDSLHIIGDKSLHIIDGDSVEARPVVAADSLEINSYKLSNNKILDVYSIQWIRGKASWSDKDRLHIDYGKMGTLLDMRFSDFSIWGSEAKNDFDESYLVTFKSRKIFGNDKIHTVKWYIHKYGKNEYKICRCDIDGVQVSVSDISIYNDEQIDAIVTLHKN